MMLGVQAAVILTAMTEADVEAMEPDQRRRFAKLCREWANRAEPPPTPKEGVLARLKDGERAQ